MLMCIWKFVYSTSECQGKKHKKSTPRNMITSVMKVDYIQYLEAYKTWLPMISSMLATGDLNTGG